VDGAFVDAPPLASLLAPRAPVGAPPSPPLHSFLLLPPSAVPPAVATQLAEAFGVAPPPPGSERALLDGPRRRCVGVLARAGGARGGGGDDRRRLDGDVWVRSPMTTCRRVFVRIYGVTGGEPGGGRPAAGEGGVAGVGRREGH